MTIRLHCFGESGNAYKAALALQLSGLDWEPVHVDFFNGGARSDEFRALNPLGEAPVLQDGALTLSQSGAIQAWISDKTGRFAGARGEKYDVLRWVLWDNHKMSSQAGAIRFLRNFLAPEKRPAEVIDFMQARLKSALKVLDDHLDGRDWIVGDQITNADLSCCGYLYYPEPFGFHRADWPNIDAWLTRLSEQPRWKHPYDLMERAFPSN